MLFFFKYFVILLCTFYIFSKLLNLYNHKNFLFYNLAVSTILTLIILNINSLLPIYLHISILLLATPALLHMHKRSIELTITTTILSFILSYSIFSICSVLSALIFANINISFSYEYKFYLVLGTTILLQFLLTYLLFLPKRFRKGMPFLANSTHSTSIMLISLTLLFMFLTMRNEHNNSIIVALVFISFIFALFIYIYWRNSLTRTYNERLRLRDIDDLSKQLENKQKEYDELKADKEYLSSIVHTDNKLVPAMVLAVESFLTAFPDATPQMIARGKEILHTLDNHIEARNLNLSLQQSRCFVKLANTGIPDLNITLEYMYDQAQKQDMELGVQV